MRGLLILVAALVASPFPAFADPASVSVTLGARMMEKAQDKYGVGDVNRLAEDLRQQVMRKLAHNSAYDGARLELVIEDAKPNRPTFKQLGDVPGLSLSSLGIGGIRISGRAVAADGHVTPLAYSWYENDIRNVRGYATWTDAKQGMSMFAAQLARGPGLAAR